MKAEYAVRFWPFNFNYIFNHVTCGKKKKLDISVMNKVKAYTKGNIFYTCAGVRKNHNNWYIRAVTTRASVNCIFKFRTYREPNLTFCFLGKCPGNAVLANPKELVK